MRRRTLVAGLLVAGVVAGALVNELDGRAEPDGPTSVAGAIGEDVRVHPYRVHVNGAVAAESLVDADAFDEQAPLTTDGVWVVIDLSYATIDEPRAPGGSGLVVRDGEGREYPVSSRSGVSSWLAGPDIWVRGDLAFEVAPDSLDGLELVFAPEAASVGPMPTRYAVIPLELGAGDLRAEAELGDSEELGEGER